jgi:hypothetical protein
MIKSTWDYVFRGIFLLLLLFGILVLGTQIHDGKFQSNINNQIYSFESIY